MKPIARVVEINNLSPSLNLENWATKSFHLARNINALLGLMVAMFVFTILATDAFNLAKICFDLFDFLRPEYPNDHGDDEQNQNNLWVAKEKIQNAQRCQTQDDQNKQQND